MSLLLPEELDREFSAQDKLKLTRFGKTLYLFPIEGGVFTNIAQVNGFEPIEPGGKKWTRIYSEHIVFSLRDNIHVVLDKNLKAMSDKQLNWNNVKALPLPSKRKGFKHQQIANRLLMEKKRFMLAWETGVGKTKPIVDVATYLLKQNIADFTLIFTTKTIMGTWQNDAIPKDTDLESVILAGSEEQRRATLNLAIKRGVRIFICNYAVARMPDLSDLLKRRFTSKTIIVLDESHNVKSMDAGQTRGVYRLIKELESEYVFAATGTPSSQSPEDIFGQFAMIDTRLFGAPREITAFRNRYIRTYQGHNDEVIKHYVNLDHWISQFTKAAYRLTKDEALDLPPLIEQIIQLDMPPALYKRYKEFIVTGCVKTDDAEFPEIISEFPITTYMYCQELVNNWIYAKHEGALDASKRAVTVMNSVKENPKLEWLNEFLTDNDSQGIIFYEFQAELAMITQLLDKMQTSYSIIAGGLSDKQLNNSIEDFTSSKSQVLVAQTSKGGEGINLQMAKWVVYFTHPRRVTSFEQSQGRAYRMGVQHNVTLYHLVYKHTIDTSKYKTLINKIDLGKVITSGTPELMQSIMLGEVDLKDFSQRAHI